MCAVHCEARFNIVRLLIAKNKNSVNGVCEQGSTVLEWGMWSNLLQTDELLEIIDAMNPEVIEHHTNSFGNTILFTATVEYFENRVSIQVIRKLVPHSNRSRKNENYQTVLEYACMRYRNDADKIKALEYIEEVLEGVPPSKIHEAVSLHTDPVALLSKITARAYARLAERATLSAALKEGIGLPGALALTYL
jgi:hypothetical protein